jgi:hypothetical protein
MEQQRTVQEAGKGSGCGKAAAIGCGVVALLLVLLGVAGYVGCQRVIAKVAEYTGTTPQPIPKVEASDSEIASVLSRWSDFKKACGDNKPPQPLTLSSQDINILIQRDPDMKEAADHVYVKIEGDRMTCQVSVPLDAIGEALGPFGKALKGRYFNGAATLRVELVAGRLMIFADSLEANGKVIPDEFMQNLRAKNLADDFNKDPKNAAFLQSIESIAIRNSTFQIVPRAGR